jgi:hypothetical protein
MLILTSETFTQLQADAGNSIVICQNQSGVKPDTIGGNPSANGGIGDYQYTWETVLDTSSFSIDYYYTASDFLDDTTKSNPIVVQTLPTLLAGNSLNFKLTVKDSIGNEATDSVDIVFSQIDGISLWSLSFDIYPGDSVMIDAEIGTIAMNLPIETYIWQPGRGLKDSTSAVTWAMPCEKVEYSLTVIDTGGCSVSAGPFYVIDFVEGTNVNSTKGVNLSVYPNPITKQSIIRLPEYIEGGNYQIIIFDKKGTVIIKDNLNNSVYPLRFIKIPGTYFFTILNSSKEIYSGTFIKD